MYVITYCFLYLQLDAYKSGPSYDIRRSIYKFINDALELIDHVATSLVIASSLKIKFINKSLARRFARELSERVFVN